jgi:hypothetical protein
MIHEYPVFHNGAKLGNARCYWNERGEAIIKAIGFKFPPNTSLELIGSTPENTRIEVSSGP